MHIYVYLCEKHNTRLVLDPSYLDINKSKFLQCNWKEFYGDVKEAVSPDAPEPHGKEVDLHMYVDSDHAGYKEAQISSTGFLIYINKALVQWLSKKQPTIETSVFGDEFVATKIGMETLHGLRCKLY